jgi:hypothetical protein
VVTRFGRLAPVLLAGALAAPPAVAAHGTPVQGLDGSPVEALAVPSSARAVVLLFLSVECPVSNRYAPELRRLRDHFTRRGMVFRHVYPNPRESAQAIRAHAGAYGLLAEPIRDPAHSLVRKAGVTTTPEAAVFDAAGRRVYKGRLDDRFVSLGVMRAAPIRRELEAALEAVIAGATPEPPMGPAVGCFIADFVPATPAAVGAGQ